jgi:uncharacterized membrane protein
METQLNIQREKSRSEITFLVLLVIPAAYLAAIWTSLPDVVPIHFNIHMKADDWGSKWTLLFAGCGIAIPIYFLLRFLPKIDPKKKISATSKAYYIIRICTHILLCAISCWIIFITSNYGKMALSFRIVPVLVSGFMIVIGNYMPTMKQNYFVGFRTPWTLENNEVWIKTHTVFGKVFFFGGIIGLLLGLFLPELVADFVVIGLMVTIALAGTIYSYVLFRKLQKEQSH